MAEEMCAVAKARDRAPLCVTAAWGNKEEQRWLVRQYHLVGQLDCQGSSHQEEAAMMPAPHRQPGCWPWGPYG